MGLKIEGATGVGRKRTEITIETERILLISRRSGSSILWCDSCGRSLPMFTIEEAAAVMRVSVDEILRMMEDGQLHLAQMREGRVRICPRSLLAR